MSIAKIKNNTIVCKSFNLKHLAQKGPIIHKHNKKRSLRSFESSALGGFVSCPTRQTRTIHFPHTANFPWPIAPFFGLIRLLPLNSP